jgi:hypothetical protein
MLDGFYYLLKFTFAIVSFLIETTILGIGIYSLTVPRFDKTMQVLYLVVGLLLLFVGLLSFSE